MQVYRKGVYKAQPLDSIGSAGISEQSEHIYCDRYQAHDDNGQRYSEQGVPEAAHVLVGDRVLKQADLLSNNSDNKKHCHCTNSE